MKGEVKTVNSTISAIAGSGSQPGTAGPGSTAYPTAALLRFPTGNATVWLGGSTVTSSTGVPFVAGEALEVDLVNEILYAVSTTTATVYVLRRGD